MKKALRIAIADDEPDMRRYFEKMLPRMGHEVVVIAENGRELLDGCRTTDIDLIITDIKMPEMDGIQAATELLKRKQVPVILVSAFHDDELIERAEADHVLAYLIKPIKQAQLAPAIAIVMRRFAQFQAVQAEADSLHQARDDRRVIEHAKRVIMKRTDLDEVDAFHRLQELAGEKSIKLVTLASAVVTAAGAFD